MEDEITKKINNMVASELSAYPDARKNAKLSLEEKEDEDKRKKPEDYLIDPDDIKQIYLLAKNKKLSANKIKEKMKDFLKEPEELKDFLKINHAALYLLLVKLDYN
jgi:phosphoenolpyruvate carboxylase